MRRVALVLVMTMLGLQGLTGVASALVSGCTYNGATSTLTVVGDDVANDRSATLWVDNAELYCDVDGNIPADWHGPAGSVTSISMQATNDVRIYLYDWTTGLTVPFSGNWVYLSAGRQIRFIGTGGTQAQAVTVQDTGLYLAGATGSADAPSIWFEGGSANDFFDASVLTRARVTANGAGGNDVIYGGTQGDTLTGGDGADVLVGGRGWDTIATGDLTPADAVRPGDGNDTITGPAAVVSYEDSSIGVKIDLTGATPTVTDGAARVDRFSAGPSAYRTWRGSSQADTFLGSIGRDGFAGGPGNDAADAGGGNDELLGEGGRDQLRGGTGADSIMGGADADRLTGNGGSDNLSGGDGDDILYGNLGDDQLYGNLGNDQAWGSDGLDYCVAEFRDLCEAP